MKTYKPRGQVRSPRYWRRRPKKQGQKKSVWQKFKQPKVVRFIATVLFLLLLFATIGLSITFTVISKNLPQPGRLQDRVLAETTKIYDRSGDNLLYEIHGDQNRTFISLEQIPEYTKFAFIALEDKNFWQHKGLSLKHIFKSVVLYGLKKVGLYHGLVPGGSTITQQFVKNAILTPEKKITRKFKEWILSYQIEKNYSKEQILEFYFNEIPFGSTSYGLESAAQNYFSKSAKDLTLAESAILAAMVQRPTYYSPYGSHVEELFSRQHFVLDEMVDMGFITTDEAEQAKNDKIDFQQSLANIKAPHFVIYVKELLTEQFGERLVEQGGLKVFTSLDFFKQQAAEKAVNDQVEKNSSDWQASNAALVSIDPKTGEILAMVGSSDFFNEEIDGQVNVALRPRQPGSSFKPIAYTTAWQQGYFPETVVFDVITKFKTEIGKDYEPHNYDDKEHGPVSLTKALQGSLNIPAVKVLYLAGINNVLDLAEKLGYSTLTDRSRFGLSLVLGGGEVKLLEHVSAFGVLAREGIKQKPTAILKVEDSKGNTLFEFKPEKGEQVIDNKIARITNYILSDDTARSFVFGSNSLLTLPGRPVAAKTGTTNDYRDAWTVGYTPSLVTGVWVGNNDNSEMKRGASGYQVATPIWHNYMTAVLTGTPVETFKTPEYKIPDKIMLGGSLEEEKLILLDKSTGLPANEQTPAELIETKTYRQLHNILYYLDKNDPLGPVPGKNSDDIQYTGWEEAVKTWAKEQGLILDDGNVFPLGTENVKPLLDLINPQPEQEINKNFSIQLNWSASYPLQKIEFYVDDVIQTIVTENFDNPLIKNLDLSGTFSTGEHFLKIVIYDEKNNSNLVSEKIYLK